MSHIHDLIISAKGAFNVAKAVNASKPEGVAIQMQSGLVLIGRTRLIANGNAAEDALRDVRDSIPTGKGKMSSDFIIAAVAIVTESRTLKLTKGTLNALQRYPEIAKDAQIYVSSAKYDGPYPPPISLLISLPR